MGRVGKWGGWLLAFVVALMALGWTNAPGQDSERHLEIAARLEESRKTALQSLSAQARELSEVRRELEIAREQVADLEDGDDVAREAEDEAEKFRGHWRLVSYENFAEDGSVTKRDMSGRIMYDGRGNMSAQLMPQGENLRSENRRTRGYVAYFGSYDIDVERGTVTHRPEGSNIFRWVGGELLRYYSFSDGKLELSLKNEERVTGTLTWERID